MTEWPVANPGPNPRRVAIVGKGIFDCVAPWGQEGFEIWGLNEAPQRAGYPSIEAHTRWFQLHNPEYLAKHYPRGLADLDVLWRQERGLSLYMDRRYDQYPDSVAFPKEEVEALSQFGWYHTSSMDWMVALAILEGFDEIGIFGIELGSAPYTAGEPISGRACLEYWIGVANGRGIDVTIGPQRTGELMMTVHHAVYRSRLQYGFQTEPGFDLKSLGWSDMR